MAAYPMHAPGQTSRLPGTTPGHKPRISAQKRAPNHRTRAAAPAQHITANEQLRKPTMTTPNATRANSPPLPTFRSTSSWRTWPSAPTVQS
jgi:hypothetical protein